LRRANKLGLLGLAIALVAAFGVISGLHGTSKVSAQAVGPSNCVNPTGGTFSVGVSFTCTMVINGGTGASITVTSLTPGFSITNVTNPLCPSGSYNGVTGIYTCGACAASTTTTTVTLTVAVVAGGTVGAIFMESAICGAVAPIGCNGSGGAASITEDCGVTGTPVTYNGTCFGVTHQPTGEEKWCTNTATTVGLQQVIGSSTLPLSVSGPGTSFTIPSFGGASTCAIQLTENGTPCGLPTVAGTVICADGYVVVSLTTPGSSAVISCASPGLPAGQTYPTGITGLQISPNGGACQSLSIGTVLSIPCGITATGGGVSASSFTCSSVQFDIASMLSGCLSGQTIVQACPLGSNAYTLTGGTATVQISFQATGFNGGINGGVVLGTNSYQFQAPGVGTLLVTATPQLIPSNGTLASVVTATMGCGTGFNLTNTGFPLSSFLLG